MTNTGQAALLQAAQEAEPERRRLRRPKAKAENLAPAVVVHAGGDYCRNWHDPTALAHLKISRVEPKIRPLALDPAVEESLDPPVNLLAFLGNLALRNAA